MNRILEVKTMNRIIRKYKSVDMQLQTSRKQVRKITIFYILVLVILIWVTILYNYTVNETTKSQLPILQLILIWLVLISFNLVTIDWSIKIQDNKLFIRRWIFKLEIPFKDLIDIIDDDLWIDSSSKSFIIIQYKKGKKIRSLILHYLWEVPFFRYEFIKKSDITKLVNIFYRDGGPIEGVKETNPLLREYKDIRTREEEKEIDNLTNKPKIREEVIIWIGIFMFVAIFFIAFLTAFFIIK